MTTPAPGPWIESWLSAPRFGVYLTAAGGDRAKAVALYEWNASISAAFLHDLAHLEVGLRNAYDTALRSSIPAGQPHWVFDDTRYFPVTWRRAKNGTRYDANKINREQIARAIAEASVPRPAAAPRAGAPTVPPPGKVVAELMFGFWRFLSTTAQHHLTGDDGGAEWLLALAIHIGQIRCGIDTYALQMADDSRRHGLEPIPLRLTASPQQIEDELHRSMWDVAIGQSLDEPVDVLAEAAAVADSVDAAIAAAWSIRERVRVHDTPPADSPDGTAALRPTVSNLRLLRQSLDDDTQTSTATSDELGRLNGYHQ